MNNEYELQKSGSQASPSSSISYSGVSGAAQNYQLEIQTDTAHSAGSKEVQQ